jgi:hypothetical protein
MATWDQMSAGTWDQLFTWDEPDRNIALDAAYALGAITVDAAELTVDWAGDTPSDLLSPSLARDEFPIQIVATDSFTRSVSSGVGATEQGSQYTTVNGSASDYNVNGSVLTISNGSLAVQRRVQLLSLSALHSDFTITSRISTIITGAGGNAEVALRTRFQDSNNFTDIRVFRNVTTANVTVAVRQFVGGVETVSSFATVPAATLTSSVTLRVVTRGNILYGWAWVEGTTPPVAPSVTLTAVTWLTAGTFEFYSRLNSSVTNTLPVTMSFDNLTIINNDLLATSVGAHPWAGGTGTTVQFFSLDSGMALLRPEAINTVYLMLVNDISEIDFDILAKVRATTLTTGARVSILLVARYQDANNYLRFRLDFNIDQIMGWAVEAIVGGSGTPIASGLFSDLFHTVDGWIRFRVQGLGATLRLKAWADDDRINRDWTAYATDTAFPSTPGRSGWGGYVLGGYLGSLPYIELQADQYWQGANGALDAGSISVGLSLDDGLPSTVTNTQNIGVNEAGAELLGPIGTSPDIFFSNFRADQPFADLDRDTAGVAITAQVLTADGVRPVRVFTGRMSDIPLDDQSAKLTAISSARLALSAPIQPPAVHGYYEGKEATWLIGYILFKAGLYVAPRPLDGCRLYIPLNGTTHAYLPDTNSGAAPLSGVNYGALNQAAYAPPKWMDGPFTAAPDLVINETAVRKLQSGPGTLAYPDSFAAGDDFLSQTGNKGRIEAWIKGDPTNAAASMNPTQGNLVQIRVRNSGITRYAALIVTSTRQIRGQISDGVSTIFYPLFDLPNDGLWHFVSFSWNLKPFTGTCTITMDTQSLSYGMGITTSNLAVSDDIDRAEFDIAIPTVEIRFTTGDTAAKAGYANQIIFSPDALMRRSLLNFEAIAESAPREGFELLSSLAQAELANIGFDELDRFLYFPLSYWAEKQQQLVGETLSTDSNLGRRFKAAQNVRKTFNQITLSYKQTYVNETWITGFQTSQLVRVGAGESVDLMAALSVPAIEMRGLTLAVMSGAALAATPPSVTNAINYLTMNTATDGTGTYATSSDVLGKIVAWTPGSVTVRLQNNSPTAFYLSNNVSIPPLGVAVKQVVIADATVNASQPDSIAARGIRNLPVSLPSIQSAANASTIASALAGFLAFPRTSLTSDVWGDFRRKPGSLVWVSDVDNTGLSDSFRLTGITTVQDGADVQQVISAVQAWRVQNWGSGSWGSGIWGES